MTDEPKDVLLAIDEDARLLARVLLRTARHAALATIEAETGYPLASRTAVASDETGAPLILVSKLAPHSGALAADPRCSFLFGEPGKGDPLAHPRLMVTGHAQFIERGTDVRERLRRRFLARHPKSATYIDFGDFDLVRIEVERARLNGGFARAFALTPADLCEPVTPELLAAEPRVIDHMNSDHRDAIDTLAGHFLRSGDRGWRLATLDPRGFEMMLGDRLERIEFDRPARESSDYRAFIVDLVGRAEQASSADRP
ncbi:HugZ family protein [Consotaella aegiceratis]|uniref:HugZ family pyridoxamine 5'-phosphate oxidase n=1 Tax=Consotaella aegiceratis TaxID=3097961 RepID=UPI002F415FBD